MTNRDEHESKMAIRRREVEEYMATSNEREAMRELAEAGMEHAAELLDRVELEGEERR